MIKIENLSIKEKSIVRTKELDGIAESMKEYGIEDPYALLPKNTWHEVSFNLKNTHTGFAHGLYRIMDEEMEVLCATTNEEFIVSDDKFITDSSYSLIKNINLLPVRQSLTDEELAEYDIYLYKYNDSDDIIDVHAKDFIVVNKKQRNTKKHASKRGKGENDNEKNKFTSKNNKTSSNISKLRKGTIKGSKLGGKVAEKKTGAEENNAESKDDDDEENNAESKDDDEENNAESKDDDEENNADNSKEDKFEIIELDQTVNNDLIEIENTHSLEHKGDIDITHIFPEPNCLIMRLRPGKYLKINNLLFERGRQKDNAAKFSLLNNIRYHPTDIVPYNIFAKTEAERGTRSVEHDSKEFYISFTTCGNILPKEVIDLTIARLTTELLSIRDKILKYSKTDTSKKYYNDEGIEVTYINEIYTYTLYNQYLTTINMISQRCYVIDPSISFCAGAVKRFDTEVGIIKMIHADSNKLIISAIDSCLEDAKVIQKAFDKK